MADVVQHPVLPIPRVRDFWYDGCTEQEVFERWQAAHKRRNEMIRQEQADPLRYGYEPGKWKLADAVTGQPCWDLAFVGKIKDRFGLGWDEFSAEVRRLFGFPEVIKILLINGTNRSGKTYYVAKRVNQNMAELDDFQVWCYAETSNNSIRIQQKALRYFNPPEYRKAIKTDTAYVNYSQQRGYVDSHFIFPVTLSECDLRNYAQDVKTVEGGDNNLLWADELVPPAFMNAFPARVASRDGLLVVTFTPVEGYTPVVAEFHNSAETMMSVPAYFLPVDGGPADVARALGFDSEEERLDALRDGIRSRPWDFVEWFEWAKLGEELYGAGSADVLGKLEGRVAADGRMVRPGLPLPPAGRHFEMVPMVKRCRVTSGNDGALLNRGIVYFHPMDNAYTDTLALYKTVQGKARSFVKIKMYGEAERMQANQIPKFDRKLHVIPDDKVPKAGSVYQIMDPTPGGRPYVWGYFRVTRHGAYLYREFPRVDLSAEEIDLADFPSGDWAVVSERKAGVNDGDPGPACQPIGWGLRRYKQQFAIEEGWEDAAEPAEGGAASHDVDDWMAENGARELVEVRFIDPAAAEMPRQTDDEATTLTEQFEDLGLYFEHALRGKSTADRIRAINNLFDYEVNAEGEVVRYPWLRVAASCKNTIYCVENYLGVDGNKGVMKDFIDVLGYFAMLDLEYVERGNWQSSGGGYM